MTKQMTKHNDRRAEFVPVGETVPITLTVGMVRDFLCRPTKRGAMPTDQDIVRFIMLCKAQELNPWTDDAYLMGYDGKDGPEWSLVTSVNALLKRAEMNPAFNGMQSGVIVQTKNGQLFYRDGDFYLDGEKLLGGWARCHRKDREHPFYDALKLETYNKNHSRWSTDPAGMIVKCAESHVLRTAFPCQLSALRTADEMLGSPARVTDGEALPVPLPSAPTERPVEVDVPQRDDQDKAEPDPKTLPATNAQRGKIEHLRVTGDVTRQRFAEILDSLEMDWESLTQEEAQYLIATLEERQNRQMQETAGTN